MLSKKLVYSDLIYCDYDCKTLERFKLKVQQIIIL